MAKRQKSQWQLATGGGCAGWPLATGSSRLSFHGFGSREGGCPLEFRFIANDELTVAVRSHAEEIGVVLVEGTECVAAGYKAEFAEKVGLTMDIERPPLDFVLPESEIKQFGPDTLPLEVGCHRDGAEVQAADHSVIGIGE